MQQKLIMLFALGAVAAVLVAACSGDDESRDTNGQYTAMLAALTTLDGANLHHIEDTLGGDDPEIDPAWLGPLLHARTATALITWPHELSDAATAFLAESEVLAIAIDADDLEAAIDAAPAAHDAWHLLEEPAYAYLAARAGTGSLAVHDDDDHDE